MGLMWTGFDQGVCCLCGSSGEASGEHKVKASLLKSEFGPEKMVIGRFGGAEDSVRSAQGPRSKVFHFKARMCKPCNSARTERPDSEFDRFNRMARNLLESGTDPASVFDDVRYAVGSEPYLNVFRYFAKLLCCHIAEIEAPRMNHLAAFAIGRHQTNRVWLKIDEDWTYRKASAELGPHQYASHGGLTIYGDKNTKRATAFHSTLTIGALRYVFFTRFNAIECLELAFFHSTFARWCQEQILRSDEQPMSDEEQLALGFEYPEGKS